MSKIAIIGNSHVAAFKMGWDLIEKDHSHLDVVFFASVGKAAQTRTLDGKMFGFLSPKPAADEIVFGNHTERSINLAKFDHVLRVSEAKKESLLATVLDNTVVDGWPADGRAHHMSQSAFEALVAYTAKTQVMSSDWCNWDSPKITNCPAPYPDERCVGRERPTKLDRWRTLAKRPEELLWLREMYIEKHRAVLEQKGVGLLTQPAETIGKNGLTLQKYSEGSFRMDTNKMEAHEEHIHMNAAFGKLLLEKYFAQIGCATTKN